MHAAKSRKVKGVEPQRPREISLVKNEFATFRSVCKRKHRISKQARCLQLKAKILLNWRKIATTIMQKEIIDRNHHLATPKLITNSRSKAIVKRSDAERESREEKSCVCISRNSMLLSE